MRHHVMYWLWILSRDTYRPNWLNLDGVKKKAACFPSREMNVEIKTFSASSGSSNFIVTRLLLEIIGHHFGLWGFDLSRLRLIASLL